MSGIATYGYHKHKHLVVSTLCRGNYITGNVPYVHDLQNLFFCLANNQDLDINKEFLNELKLKNNDKFL